MGFISKLLGKPKQPDLTFAANGFFPIAIMQANDVDADYYAIADGYAQTLLNEGCTLHQAQSARWGGVTAIGQNLDLFSSFVASHEETLAEMGIVPDKSKDTTKAKYRAAATMFLAYVMSDAPGEYERFLKYVNR